VLIFVFAGKVSADEEKANRLGRVVNEILIVSGLLWVLPNKALQLTAPSVTVLAR
jgi:hypothetical protein